MAEEFKLPIVVSGQQIDVAVNVHQTLEQVVHRALEISGNVGQKPEDWDLRTAAGTLLNLSLTVGQAGLNASTVVYLNPHTGTGG
jgi:hypothetical protein